MASDNCDPVWRSVCGPRRRGIARHKDQKSFRAIAHTDSQTPKEETDTNSVARDFAETKESFSESIANRDAQEQIKAQKNNSDPNTRARRKSIRDSGTNACSRKKGLAQREPLSGKSAPKSRYRARANKRESRLHVWLCRSEERRDGLFRFHLLRPSAKRFPRRTARFQPAICLGPQSGKFLCGPESQGGFIRIR